MEFFCFLSPRLVLQAEKREYPIGLKHFPHLQVRLLHRSTKMLHSRFTTLLYECTGLFCELNSKAAYDLLMMNIDHDAAYEGVRCKLTYASTIMTPFTTVYTNLIFESRYV